MIYALILKNYLNESHHVGSSNDSSTENIDNGDKSQNIYVSLITSIVMMIGELDASNISFEKNGFSYLVFVLFILFVSIILFNLLNGLAVSDIQVS